MKKVGVGKSEERRDQVYPNPNPTLPSNSPNFLMPPTINELEPKNKIACNS